MNKFVTGTLALAVAGSVTYAAPPTSDWLELDSEISTLATSMTATGEYINIKVLLRGGYAYASDDLSTGAGMYSDADDISGFRFWDVVVAGGAQVGDVNLRLSFNFARPETDFSSKKSLWGGEGLGAVLEDAYAVWSCGDTVDVIAGQYKPHITRTSYTDPENLFFLERSAIGAEFDAYDMGFGLRGSYEQFAWNVDVMNGSSPLLDNGICSGHVYIVRALWNFGRDAGGYEEDPEDAYGAGDDHAGSLGFFYLSEDISGADTNIYGIDGQGTFGQIGWGFEYESRDDDAYGILISPWNVLSSGLLMQGDSNPFMLYGTYMVNEEWGVGLRYEALDNDDDGTDNDIITLGVNMYDVGHNGKIGASIAMISDDRDDATVFQAGYTYGASR
jgi:hypothetical protein